MKNKSSNSPKKNLTMEEITKQLEEVMFRKRIKPPSKEELKNIDSLGKFFKDQREKGKCLLWCCPICRNKIKEITSIVQIKDLLSSFQERTVHNKCKNKHRNWFYIKGATLVFKAEVSTDNIEEKGKKWFSLTGKEYKKKSTRRHLT